MSFFIALSLPPPYARRKRGRTLRGLLYVRCQRGDLLPSLCGVHEPFATRSRKHNVKCFSSSFWPFAALLRLMDPSLSTMQSIDFRSLAWNWVRGQGAPMSLRHHILVSAVKTSRYRFSISNSEQRVIMTVMPCRAKDCFVFLLAVL